jgi:hypothetical protein
MKVESIPPALRNLLTKLEYISMIERGQKPCFSDMTFVNSNSWFGAWKRLFTGENKKNLLFEIEQIIDRTILAIEEYSNKEYVKLLIDNLAKAKIGIENLILTYTEHPETISNLRVHIINIDLTLKKHGYHPESKNSVEEKPNASDELQKMIDNFGNKNIQPSHPLPIVIVDSKKQQKLKPESYKRFTPKDYIEKQMFTSSSPDTNLKKPNLDESTSTPSS